MFNSSQATKGAQLSVVNVSGNVSGAQVGVVNVARDVRGLQFGLVNVSRRNYGIPIGLINISQDGLFSPGGWLDDLGMAYGGMQIGTRSVYTLIYAGVPFEQPDTALTVGAGMGYQFYIDQLFINADISARRTVHGDAFEYNLLNIATEAGTTTTPTVRLLAGVRVIGNISVYGGVSLDAHIPGYTDNAREIEGRTLWKSIPLDDFEISAHIDLYPTWFFGIRL